MRIGIANGSASGEKTLRQIITGTHRHVVAWVAHSGADTISRCAEDTPDAILLDLVMPGMNAAETTRRIMRTTPCAIIIVSESIRNNPARIFEAMGAGAVDAIDAPEVDPAINRTGADALVRKLDIIGKLVRPAEVGSSLKKSGPQKPAGLPLVVIGASAGGPAALAAVLRPLPKDFSPAVIMIQHVNPRFTGGLVEWLGQQSPLPVHVADEGTRPQPGVVLLAAREEHLILTSANRLGYTSAPAECSYRPSIDVFLTSVSRHWKGPVVAVLLTGMGRDGAEGLRILRKSGQHTIAQDRQSSAVFGMPKAAADLDAATEILGLDKIGPRLANMFPAA
jgi:chemotaxis response regulator CheB